jgi:histone H3/H4
MAKKKKKASTTPDLVVKSKCKEALKAHDVNVAADALDGLNCVCGWYIEQAANRAKANNRKTVRAHDFLVLG